MTTETHACQFCKQTFVIESEDQAFLKKFDAPEPTWCPSCRLQRRLVWRNERVMYKRRCDAPGHDHDIVALFSTDKPFKVYCCPFWWSDSWSGGTEHGRDYDFSKPFFAQFKDLVAAVPKANMMGDFVTMINSEYSNWSGELKNTYLITDADSVEDSAYGSGIMRSKDLFDTDTASDSELCYDSFNLEKCYKTVGSVDCVNCTEVYFSKNCTGCQNCFGCVNLRNKSYHIFNEPVPKEVYAKKIEELLGGSRTNYERARSKAHDIWQTAPQKFYHGYGNEAGSGDYIFHSKNTQDGFIVADVEDGRHVALIHAKGTKDVMDYTDWGDQAQRLYECLSVGINAYNIKYSHMVWKNVRDVEYSYFCGNISNCFGCTGIRNKQYCILNKQYTKEDYEAFVSKIRTHMDEMPYTDAAGRTYRYGEFFPPEISVFDYNETIAQEFFPLTKESAATLGLRWKDPEDRGYKATIPADKIPDAIKDTPDTITKELLKCTHDGSCNDQCTKVFRIIPMELKFLKNMDLPIPSLCPNCRHASRITHRNPPRLGSRQCMCNIRGQKSEVRYQNTAVHFHGDKQCPTEFETAYTEPNPTIIFCEPCYQAEVL